SYPQVGDSSRGGGCRLCTCWVDPMSWRLVRRMSWGWVHPELGLTERVGSHLLGVTPARVLHRVRRKRVVGGAVAWALAGYGSPPRRVGVDERGAASRKRARGHSERSLLGKALGALGALVTGLGGGATREGRAR